MEFRDFQPVLAAATRMNAFERPWCVAGGWAIDLWLGRKTREHADVEVTILRDDQVRLKDHLADFRFYVAEGHEKLRPWKDRQMLMWPLHELHAWGPGKFHIEFLLGELDGVEWVYRRDPRVRRHVSSWQRRGAFAVPVLSPAIVLLFKSKQPRAQDELDFRVALERLDDEDRHWLASSLALCSPGHRWIDALTR